MTLLVSPLQIAATTAAAGLATLAWSKRRASRTAMVADVEGRLRGFYRSVESRGAPPHLLDLIDSLEG